MIRFRVYATLLIIVQLAQPVLSEELNLWSQYLAGLEPYLRIAVPELRLRADEGIPQAQFILGIRHEFGNEVEKDLGVAEVWYRKAAEQGLAVAQGCLAGLLQRADGVRDCAEIEKYFRMAAEQGLAAAQNDLGLLYYKGDCVPQDFERAVPLFLEAANQGMISAQISLAACYYNGNGVEQNYPESVKWYRKAAEQGNARAMGMLAVAHVLGQGVPQDYAAALNYATYSAQHGDAGGQFVLGNMYENGWGVNEDPIEAYKWFNLSGAQDDEVSEMSRTKRDRLSSTMTPEQVAEAQKRTLEWMVAHPKPSAELEKDAPDVPLPALPTR